LMGYQFFAGLAITLISRCRKSAKAFYKVRLSHRYIGLVLYLLAKANIFVGVFLHGNTWLKWLLPIEAVLLALNVFVRLWMAYRNTKYQPIYSVASSKLSNTAMQKKLVADINSGMTTEELIRNFPRIKFAYLFNRIYDLTSFDHPGGNFIISSVKGRELGRFMYGAYSLEAMNHKKYHHTTTDMAILNRYYIGEINQNESSFLVSKDLNKPAVTHSFVDWSFVKKTQLTKYIARFEFSNPTLKIKNDMKGVSWFGKHFYIAKDLVKGPVRPYTTCLSLGDAWINFRKKTVEYFDAKMSDKEEVVPIEPLQPLSDTITFVIKQYHNPKALALSKFMHTDLDESKSILMNGPVGTGLELSTDSKGIHYIFAMGTGVLPFIDLLNFILFKSMYLALKQKHGSKIAQQIDFHGADYERSLSNNFKLVLYTAFAPGEENIGYDIIKKAAEINAKYNLDLFEAHVKGVEEDPYVKKIAKHIDGQFIRERVNKEASKVYICGSPAFNQNVPNHLQNMGVDPLKIMLV